MVDLELLRAVRNFLVSVSQRVQKGWHKGNMAITAEGEIVEPTNPAACRWCLMGAIMAELPFTKPSVANRAIAMMDSIPDIIAFNDAQKSVEPVVTLLDWLVFNIDYQLSEGAVQ